MDEEKLWLLQHASELEKKLKVYEKSLSDEEVKLNLVDAIEKAIEKEKIILEVKINEIQLKLDNSKLENKLLAEEVASKSTIISNMQSCLLEKENQSNLNMTQLLSEISSLKHELEIASKTEEIYKEKINELLISFEEFQKNALNAYSALSVDKLKGDLSLKELKINELETKLSDLDTKYQELLQKYNKFTAEKPSFAKQICLLDINNQETNKKLQEAYVIIKEKDDKLLNFISEYEKKAPKLIEQKENYEKLIISNENLKFSYEELSKTKANLEEKNTNLISQNELLNSQKEILEDNCKRLCSQLSNSLYTKQLDLNSLDFSNIEELIQQNLESSSIIQKCNNEIEELSLKIKDLQERPLIIEEIVENIDYSKYITLELMYQEQQENKKKYIQKIQDLEIENNKLKSQLIMIQGQEIKYRERIDQVSKENDLLKRKISNIELQKIIQKEEPLDIYSKINTFNENCLQDYKIEIERLKKYNNDMHLALKSNQKQFIQCQEEHKYKINEILHEKALIYEELKKNQSELQNKVKEAIDKEKEFKEEIKKKEMIVEQIDKKEFIAINELNQARELIENQKNSLENMSNQMNLLKEENNILHNKLNATSQKAISQAFKSKLEDSLQISNILKYNCELYEKELKILRQTNLDLEQNLYNAHKEINSTIKNNQITPKPQENLIKNNEKSLTIYEEKIGQLLSDLERKDKQIISLVSMFSKKEYIPEIMSKIVTVLHKASNIIKK